jgi:1-phosphofructokinase
MTPIITVTLNPAIDETVVLDHLTPGEVHRATAVRFDAGGKGVNVASCLADWISGPPVIATGILGAANAYVFEELFAAKKITDAFIRIPGATRTNIKLTHAGETTDINLPGLAADPRSVLTIYKTILDLAVENALVLLAGSVPGGIGTSLYAELVGGLQGRGARVVLDTSGAALDRALNAKILPYCIKPNRSELEQVCRRALAADDDVITAAQALVSRGVGLVIVSLGAEGSLYVTKGEVLRASLPAIRPASTVGAGDAMVAGIIAALHDGAELEGIARLATAFAVAKLGVIGPNLPSRKVVEEIFENVQITRIGEQA